MKPIIAVKIPTLTTVNSSLLVFVSALAAMRDVPYEFQIGVVQNHKPHDYARNTAIRDVFKNENIAKVWFIDSDIIPNPRAMRLLSVDADIAVGPYPIVKRDDEGLLVPQTTAYVFKDEEVFHPIEFNGEGFCEVDGAGMGMMVIGRNVLTDERMWLDNDPADYIGKKPTVEHVLFRHSYNPDGSMSVGEDMDFCRRARGCGYRIVADSSIHTGHMKELDLHDVQRALWAKSA